MAHRVYVKGGLYKTCTVARSPRRNHELHEGAALARSVAAQRELVARHWTCVDGTPGGSLGAMLWTN
jgi:hypothetical protein